MNLSEEEIRTIRKQHRERWDYFFQCVQNGLISSNDPMVIDAANKLQEIDKIIVYRGLGYILREP